MSHNHPHTTDRKNKKTLIISLILIATFMIVEVVGGYLTNSLSLIADAGHMLSDAISLFIALIAFTISSQSPNHQKTYGYKRFEILAAVFNGVTLILISIYIIYEAIQRFRTPAEIASTGMLTIATIGLLINILVAWIMMRGSDVKTNLNMRGAYLHVISDMLGSIGAIIAALLIMFFGWTWADPLASIIVSIFVLRSGYFVTKASVHILMEGTPDHFKIDEIKTIILKNKDVIDVHDLHIWTITSGVHVLTCHIIVSDHIDLSEIGTILKSIEHDLQHVDIQHATIQAEPRSLQHESHLFCNLKGGADAEHQH